MRTYIFDIDGVLADERHRRHHIEGDKKDWLAYFMDCGTDPSFKFFYQFVMENYENVAFVTGRSEVCREATLDWLAQEFLIFDANVNFRALGDHRPAVEYKRDIVSAMLRAGADIELAVDDDPEVVGMYKELGIKTLLVDFYR